MNRLVFTGNGGRRSIGGRQETKDGAEFVLPAIGRGAVECAVASLDQPRSEEAAGCGIIKMLQHAITGAVRVYFEHGAPVVRAATRGRAIEFSVTALNQPGYGKSAFRGRMEIPKNGKVAPVRVQVKQGAVFEAAPSLAVP